jgi:hypothetical protein
MQKNFRFATRILYYLIIDSLLSPLLVQITLSIRHKPLFVQWFFIASHFSFLSQFFKFIVRNIFCTKPHMPSSVVNNYKYFPETEILRIIYQSGAVYDYLKVPQEVFDRFKTVQSKGRFLNYVIKPKFKYKKIK